MKVWRNLKIKQRIRGCLNQPKIFIPSLIRSFGTDAKTDHSKKKKKESETETAKPQKSTENEDISIEEMKAREEWGAKFQDECFTFEREWKKIADEKNKEQDIFLQEELNEDQKKKVEFLANKVLSLNIFEARYFHSRLREKILKSTGINPMKLNVDWPSMKQDSEGTWPPINPNWFKQQEIMAKIGPFINLGGAQAAQGDETKSGDSTKKEEAPEPEKKPEKKYVDIELSSFDAPQKIKLIKEFRAMFNLGLKEAKETVEGAPVWIKKEVKVEEAEKIVEKLESFGGKCKMV